MQIFPQAILAVVYGAGGNPARSPVGNRAKLETVTKVMKITNLKDGIPSNVNLTAVLRT
jgi:hypothetical protein